MNKLLVAVMVACLVAVSACGADTQREDLPNEVASIQSELTTCGLICPPGYDPIWSCSTGCPGGCPNSALCVPIPPSASITASPEIVIVPPAGLGKSKICWNTRGLRYPIWIKVSSNGASEQLYTKESDPGKACETATWIQAGSTYDFRIRTAKDGGSILANVRVIGKL